MPTFEFTSPDGKKYSVNGPDGATKEQAFQILQAQLGASQAPAAQPAPQNFQPIDTGDLSGSRNVGTQPDPSFVDRLIGGGETALALATGATTGLMGAANGAVSGLIGNLTGGKYGNPAGVEAGMAQGMANNTYQPRTETGQAYTQKVGEVLQAVDPNLPMTAEVGALARGLGDSARGSKTIVRATADRLNAPIAAAEEVAAAAPKSDLLRAPKGSPESPVVSQIRKVSPTVADKVQRTLNLNPEKVPEPSPGSLSADATDIATQRQQLADQVGVDLTSGQLTRDQEQLRFEQETAKGDQGAPIRDRYSEQNEQISKHFDNLVDMTGKETADLIGTGRSVDEALRQKVAQDKARIRVAYNEADKAGEMSAPVDLTTLVDHLNESAPDAATAPLLNTARARAIQLGIAAEDDAGNLVALPTTIKNAERYRQAIGRATDFEPTNVRQSAIIKGAIDSATEGAAGDLYQAARRMRENFAKQYEDRGVIASLLNNKKGMADRKVAVEDVFNHSILNASRDDVAYVRRALTAHPVDALPQVKAAGQQAWRDLQGETMNWLKEQAFANTATDQRGNVILSVPKLDRAIKRLDADRRLDVIFGKQKAQHLRDINDLAKVIYTTPPGTVNTSNTASVLMAALAEAGATGSLTGVPIPVASSLRMLAKYSKNRQLRKRIEDALQGHIVQK